MKDLPVSPLAPAAFPAIEPIAGLRFAIGRAGFYKHERPEILLTRLDAGTTAAGVFTRSSTRAAPVAWCRQALAQSGGAVRAIVVNAGNANAFTGAAGDAAVRVTAETAAALQGCAPEAVLIASTGVIGQPFAPEKLTGPLARLADAPPAGFEEAARAIMTTDTYPKGAQARAMLGETPIRIAGFAKGSGMIAPNMATMLAFVFTDAAVAPDLLQTLLGELAEETFNAITVDSDESTNDTLILAATGAAGNAPLTADSPERFAFRTALGAVLMDLALQVVKDGEGAQKLIQVTVTGAESPASARTIARSIANSPLVKTAIAGEDANWGRVVMAVGKAREPIALDRLSVMFCGVETARAGGAVAYDEALVDARMKGRSIEIAVDVGVGAARATVWTCDLTHGYIAINGDYRS